MKWAIRVHTAALGHKGSGQGIRTDRAQDRTGIQAPAVVQASEDALLQRLKTLPQLKELDFQEPWPEIIRLAQSLIGSPRNLSVHSGGVVITPRPIDEYVPLEIAPKGVPIVQWEKDGTEDSGLVKIDLLGNRSLAVIQDAIVNVRQDGQDFEEKGWEPEDDRETQARIATGETMGCFYIESPATRLLQKKSGVGEQFGAVTLTIEKVEGVKSDN